MRIFGHHISRAALLLGVLETVVVYASLLLAVAIADQRPEATGLPHFAALAAGVAVVLGMSVMGLYEREQQVLVRIRRLAFLLRLVFGVLLGLLIFKLADLLFLETAALEIQTLALGGGLAVALLLSGRRLFRSLHQLNLFRRRVVVLGSGTRAGAVASASGAETPFEIVGYIALPEKATAEVPEPQVRRLQGHETLLDIARELQVDEIVVAVRDRRGTLPIKQLLECKLQGITVTDVSSFFEREQQQLQLDSLNTSWLVFGTGFRQSTIGHVAKRGFDLTASSVLLAASLPIMLVTAAAIRLEGPGPIFYWQTRVGRGNRPFEICKFRSMRPDAENDGQARWASGDDDRITRVGRVIRKLRIDELPQVFNVFRGEMSFVGPRPERPVFVEQLSEQIPYFLARHSIRPGITGWAQVRYPYGASVHDARQKLQYDLYYLKNHTLFLDLVILLETVNVVLFGRGAR